MSQSKMDFSNLDTLGKLNFLENLVFSKLTNNYNTGASSEKDFNTNLKLLLEIIKFQNKITHNQKDINFTDIFKKLSNTPKIIQQ